MVVVKVDLRYLLRHWLPLFLWMGLIFFMSSRPKGTIPSYGEWDLFVKKGAHFLSYGLLALLALWAMWDWKRPFLFALLLAILYAMSDELHQTFVAGRHGQWRDVLIDSLGALTALWLARHWLPRLLPQKHLLTRHLSQTRS